MALTPMQNCMCVCSQQVDAWSRIAKKYGLHDYYPPVHPQTVLLSSSHCSESPRSTCTTPSAKHAMNSSAMIVQTALLFCSMNGTLEKHLQRAIMRVAERFELPGSKPNGNLWTRCSRPRATCSVTSTSSAAPASTHRSAYLQEWTLHVNQLCIAPGRMTCSACPRVHAP